MQVLGAAGARAGGEDILRAALRVRLERAQDRRRLARGKGRVRVAALVLPATTISTGVASSRRTADHSRAATSPARMPEHEPEQQGGARAAIRAGRVLRPQRGDQRADLVAVGVAPCRARRGRHKGSRSRGRSLAGRFNSATGDGPWNSPLPRASLKTRFAAASTEVGQAPGAPALAQALRLALDHGGEVARLKVREQAVAERAAQGRERLCLDAEGFVSQAAALGPAREIALGERAEGGDLFDALAGAAAGERRIARLPWPPSGSRRRAGAPRRRCKRGKWPIGMRRAFLSPMRR